MTTCSNIHQWWHDFEFSDFCDPEWSDDDSELSFCKTTDDKSNDEDINQDKLIIDESSSPHGDIQQADRRIMRRNKRLCYQFEPQLEIPKPTILKRDESGRFAHKAEIANVPNDESDKAKASSPNKKRKRSSEKRINASKKIKTSKDPKASDTESQSSENSKKELEVIDQRNQSHRPTTNHTHPEIIAEVTSSGIVESG